MVRPLRNTDPSLYRLITIRTLESRLWLTPNKEVRNLLGGIVAKYQEQFKIEIYALTYLSNHPHFLIKAPIGNTDEFCENVNREVARRINWRTGRKGKFWHRRYDDQKILSEDDVLEAFLYVVNNPVKHGLVEHPGLWPGLSSYQQNIAEKKEVYSFYNYSKEEKFRVTTHQLKISPLPQFVNLSKKRRVETVKRLIDERASMYRKERKAAGHGFLGAYAVQMQDPNSIPQSSSNSPRPPGYSKNVALLRECRKSERIRREQYDEVSMRYRLGDMIVLFPKFTFKPPLHRKPRIIPFHPLPDDYFKNVA